MSAVNGDTGVHAFIPPYLSDQIARYYEQRRIIAEGDVAGTGGKFDRKNESTLLKSITYDSSLSRQQLASQDIATKESPREIWNARFVPPKLVISNGVDQSRQFDLEVGASEINMRVTDFFFRKVFQRYPVGTTSHLMRCYVHEKDVWNNAFWFSSDGSVHLGRSDPAIFNPIGLSLDIVAHEYAHAYTEFSANLEYYGQSGALNESMSDVYAAMCKHFLASLDRASPIDANSDQANWLIADGLIVNRYSEGTALRSMKTPGFGYRNHEKWGNDPQPKHMNEVGQIPQRLLDQDHGGVHILSGIPNRAFYFAASKTGGPTWARVGQVWNYTLINLAGSKDDFATFAGKTQFAAQQLKYPQGVYNAIGQAWMAVGVTPKAFRTSSSQRPGDKADSLKSKTVVKWSEPFKKLFQLRSPL